MPSRRRSSPRAIAILAVIGGLLLAGSLPTSVGAASKTLYVDGKTGSDSDDGSSPADAYRTIAKAASSLPAGSSAAGWTVSVKGYSDYVYRERPIPPGWDRRGASGAPVTFQATGYAAGSSANYTKPIVSGADIAPLVGEKWSTTSTGGVYVTPWTAKPFDYGKFKGSIRTAIFQDTTTWLWEQSSLSALGSRAAAGKGGYWFDESRHLLYVSAIGSSKDPSKHLIEVTTRNAFYFMGTNGVSYVAVRGFEVRHAANGIALAKGVDHSTIADNVLVGNHLMGVETSGVQTSSGPDPATGNVIARNRGSWNTVQLIKIGEGSTSTSVCDNIASDNGVEGIKVTGPQSGSTYKGQTTGITVCRNKLYYNDFNPTGSTYNNAAGLLITDGAQNVVVDTNYIFGNDVGIHISHESKGRAVMNGIALKRNRIYDNRRFGIDFYDGAYGAGSGSMRSDYDVLWKNGIGILVARGSSNKSISHATIHDNDAEGIKVGESTSGVGKATITSSLVTSNGGYGLWLVTGSTASLSYTGLSGNAKGSIKATTGLTTKTNNTQAPGYISTSAASSSYLRISTSSYQYTAGQSGKPIGARY